MGENKDLYDESEAEETLSLCDLALGGDWEDFSNSTEYDHRRSSEEELFEFFNDLNSQLRVAEDIIFCGKLLSCSSPSSALSNYSYKNEKGSRDRCLDITTENDSYRIPSGKSLMKRDFRSSSLARSTWKLVMFGLMKSPSPTEMKMKDIRNRQSKRIPWNMFPSLNGGETASVKTGRGKSSSWRRLLRALGLKGRSRSQSMSLSCVPNVLA